MQITGNFNAVKKALLADSSCLQDNVGNSGYIKSTSGAPVEPYPQRGLHPPEVILLFRVLRALDLLIELVLLCGLLQNETGASIQIVDTGPDSDERVVLISALEDTILHEDSSNFA
ncbi:hypothetical protein TSUD_260580 [Trifolium subterraneum]|uniref:Uncharacterized protein n=1 Tax=Trifolium subterraneum TaxID=3900 RepID=A0A2Z6NYJ4_TRISU|nr:hypothetical protein TSUD_260580 [Trifolium subterraneum]